MPQLTAAAKATALAALSIQSVSLHTAYSSTGASEVSGGVPAYSRLPITMRSQTPGILVGSAPPYVFDVPPGVTVGWVGLWDAVGIFQGMLPLGGLPIRPFVCTDHFTIVTPNHQFTGTQPIVFWQSSTGLLPTALVEGSAYLTLNPTTDDFTVTPPIGGPPLNLVTSGSGFVQAYSPVEAVSQSVLPVLNVIIDATVSV